MNVISEMFQNIGGVRFKCHESQYLQNFSEKFSNFALSEKTKNDLGNFLKTLQCNLRIFRHCEKQLWLPS